MNAELEAKAKALMAGLLGAVKMVNISGVSKGMVFASPPSLQHSTELKGGPRWEFTLNPLAKAELLAPFNHGIYRGAELFPHACCECMAPPDHVEILEAGIAVQSLSSKLTISTSQEEANRIFYAWRNQRIWYAVPYCSQHSLSNKSICISSEGTQEKAEAAKRTVTLKLKNAEFGRQFKALNGLEKAWVKPTLLGPVKFYDPADLDELPSNWMLSLALKRIPLVLAAMAAAGGALWFALSRGLTSELCSLEWIVIGLALVAVIALVMAAGSVGNFPKKKEPESQGE